MHLFFQPDFSSIYALTDDEAFHAAKVLRLREGEIVQVTDGQGSWYDAQVRQSTPKRCDLQILKQTTYEPRPYSIEIALAPTKNIDRIEWFVEKATEMGIDKISFFYTKHSERRTMKLDRLQKIAVSAMKQSLQAYLPALEEVGDFEKWLSTAQAFPRQKFLAHLPEGSMPAHLCKSVKPHQKYLVLIGPEGDFTPKEIELTQKAGFQMVVLGNTRLRTETAALVACQALHLINSLGE